MSLESCSPPAAFEFLTEDENCECNDSNCKVKRTTDCGDNVNSALNTIVSRLSAVKQLATMENTLFVTCISAMMATTIYTHHLDKIPETIFGAVFIAATLADYIRPGVPAAVFERLRSLTRRSDHQTNDKNHEYHRNAKTTPVSDSLVPQMRDLSRTLFNGAPKPTFHPFTRSGATKEIYLEYLNDTLAGTGFIKAVNEMRKFDPNVVLIPANKRWIQSIPKSPDTVVFSVNVIDRIWDETVGPTDNTVIDEVVDILEFC